MRPEDDKRIADDEGASPAERVAAACREDNTDALEEVLTEMESGKKTNEEIAAFFNSVTDPLGNHALHICAMHGSYHAADFLFDIEFFECDPRTRLDKETPLHLVARYANDKSRYNSVTDAITMVKMMCEAGCDPRVTNKNGETPSRLQDMIPEELRKELRQAEYLLNEGLGLQDDPDSDGDDARAGNSASDSE
ncbi:ankyrin repeat protein [Histoplasma capsulatum]|uniref:Ankyrin repeat protein n=1 Tax=Ajellomyces capsulatus TaxID=5037 RepID=A0A8A1MJY2_AJECA|nr:predicted protein [Histoplasma mississippiense (nom. inval.)]EDN05141.1 predicted protein [Histoplasma mississippiense (nom. inval.)]QSS64872.1 ankyrin repeat protein [Histoplasma capsulatum]